MLILIAPQLAAFALKFGPAERTTLLIFALTIVGVLASESILKGLLAGSLGLLMATVGADPMLNVPRFTFGIMDLEDGFSYIPLLIGLFAISEILINAEDRMRASFRAEYRKSLRKEDNRITWTDIVLSWKTILRSSLLGTFIGIMPGIGAAVACFFGYGEAKRASRHPELFGKGTVEGVAASEAANNAVTGSALIPLLSLSIPGDSVTAILYGALLIQGITPGPLIFQHHLDAVYLVYVTLTLANIIMVITALSAMPFFVRVTEIPRKILLPIVFVFCVMGSFSIKNNIFDVYVMMAFGIIGYLLRKFMIPVAPMLIAFILANPFEESLRQSLVSSEGDLRVFVASPISVGFLFLTALSILLTARRHLKVGQEKKRGESSSAKKEEIL
jgi:putative tricarboxylic transport membrane protein